MTKTIVVGLGNPILGDDGVGWKVAEEVQQRLPVGVPVDVEYFSLGGISLMEHIIGYDTAILIDAFQDETSGKLLVMSLDELPSYASIHTASIHDTSLPDAMRLGKSMGAKLPERVVIIGITTAYSFEFSESLSPEVQAAVPPATAAVLDLLHVSG